MNGLFDLSSKIVLITGAAGLLGEQHARAVASASGTPVLLDINESGAQRLATSLNAEFGTGAIGYGLDITNEDAVSSRTREILHHFDKIDGLINNAANNPKMESADDKNFSRLENFPLDMWNADLAVGLTGAMLCAKYFGTAIANNPEGGVILNVASDLALISPDQRLYRKDGTADDHQPVKPVTYSVVKSGLIGLTRYLASYWPGKVRCNAICPGGVENGQDEGFIADISLRIPLGRMARIDEYQGTIIYMMSEASAYMNGAIVPVDGGRSAW
jgi:NAD(P)-dependent dehydrogenase (short-subunit alcohol dehydrogenase family)